MIDERMWNKLQLRSEENLLELEAGKKNGARVIGFYCLFSPVEVAVAAGAFPLPLCGTKNDPIAAAEEVLPRNLCPLIKSSFGFAATDTCPFFRLSDLVVGDTTCDGKKKMFELLSAYRPMHVLQLPQNQDRKAALPFWLNEVRRFKETVETFTGVQITNEKLSEAIRLMNRVRQAKKRLMDLLQTNPSPIRGVDLLTILFKIGFVADKEKGIALIEEIVEHIEGNSGNNPARLSTPRPRILLTGVPVGLGSEKVVRLAEEGGADVVAFENCSGYKGVFQVDEGMEPLQALAEQYLTTPCSVMSPNSGRIDLLAQMIEDFSVDGVIDLTWQACHTYNIESYGVDRALTNRYGLPFLHLETDYSQSDIEQLRVRIEAFIETLHA